jgi:hypothetical protein
MSDLARKAARVFALAGLVGAAAANAADVPPADKLSPAEIVRSLESAGYKDVHDVEFDDGHYEADAVSPAGVAVDLDVDPRTGKVMREERD